MIMIRNKKTGMTTPPTPELLKTARKGKFDLEIVETEIMAQTPQPAGLLPGQLAGPLAPLASAPTAADPLGTGATIAGMDKQGDLDKPAEESPDTAIQEGENFRAAGINVKEQKKDKK